MKEITQETVADAADAIAAAGAKPTLRAVRGKLMGGSYTTIGPFLAVWTEARREADAHAKAVLPETLALAMAELAGRVWRVSLQEATASTLVIRQEAEAAVAQAAEELDEVRAAAARKDAAVSALSEAQAQIVRLEERVSAREREAAQAGVRADMAGAEAARLRDRLEEQAAELAARPALHGVKPAAEA